MIVMNRENPLVAKYAGASDFEKSESSSESTLDFQASLQELLSAAGLTEAALNTVLDSIAARRDSGADHLRLDEIRRLAELPSSRLDHIDECVYCTDLVKCCLDPVNVEELARQAANAPLPQKKYSTKYILRGIAACLLVAMVISAFVVGRKTSLSNLPPPAIARAVEQVDALKNKPGATAAFTAARLYSDLGLQERARTEFILALSHDNVPTAAIEKLAALTSEVGGAGWIERTSARTKIVLTQDVLGREPRTAEERLRLAKLQLKAGESTAAYESLLEYLVAIDARPAASEAFYRAGLSSPVIAAVDAQ